MNVLRNHNISVAFYGKFATIWWKKNNEDCERYWQTSGKENAPCAISKEDFAPIFYKHGAKYLKEDFQIFLSTPPISDRHL